MGTVTAMAFLASCAGGSPWAENAVRWIKAQDVAAHRSLAQLMMFYSPDAVIVPCCGQAGGRHEGREAIAIFLDGPLAADTTMGRSYIDVSGSVVEYRYAAGPDDDRPAGGGDPVDYDQLEVVEHSADGAVTLSIHPMALQVLQYPVEDGRGPFGADLGAARGLTDRYLSAWSGRDARAVAGVYAENATVLDSLLGVRLTGRDVIGAYAAQHGGARLRQDRIPQGGGPALYGYWPESKSGSWSEPLDHLTAYLTYVGDDGNGCPGGVTTQLQIEQGQIVAERRYHDIDAIRRCVDSAELPNGWWTHAVTAPMEDRVTGTVTAASQRIEVRNGTPVAEDLVQWAMERFAAAQLPAPTVSSVAFSDKIHRAQCTTRWGLALSEGDSARIFVCADVGRTPTLKEKVVLLHELGHVWLWQHLTGPVQHQFIARMHLSTWEAPDTPWAQRGMEQAADVIAWGLADEPLKGDALADRSCTDLAEAFELLTGAAPLQPPCPPGG